MSRYRRKYFDQTGYYSTVCNIRQGTNFIIKQISINTEEGVKDLRFQIWDPQGKPKVGQIRSGYYKGASGALLIFDVTRFDSLTNLTTWIEEFSNHIELPKASIVIIGNKIDLKEDIEVYPEQAKDFIDQNIATMSKFENQVKFFETSAKTGENVDKAFESLTLSIVSKM